GNVGGDKGVALLFVMERLLTGSERHEREQDQEIERCSGVAAGHGVPPFVAGARASSEGNQLVLKKRVSRRGRAAIKTSQWSPCLSSLNLARQGATKFAASGKWLVASGKRKNLRASRRSSGLVV